MEPEKGTGVNGWRVMALSLLVIVAALFCVIMVMRSNGAFLSGEEDSAAETTQQDAASEDATAESGGDATTGAADNAASAEASQQTPVYVENPVEYEVSFTFADGFNFSGVADTTVYLMEGFNNPTGELFRTLQTDQNGRADTVVPAGEYTLVWGDENYYDGMENLTIGGENGPGHDYISDSDSAYRFWKFMLPRQGGNTICLVLEWKGPEDLDLCVFNAKERRYISAIQPEDGSGAFLAADDGDGSPGWEVILIRDYTNSEVYTPYVRDGNSLIHGSMSAMEANGVRLSILDQNGLLFSQEADPAERAALWMPCYIHNGKVIKGDVYEYDPARYAWAAYTKY